MLGVVLGWRGPKHAFLNDADLTNTRLNDARLQGADLTGARLGLAKLGGADLTGACLKDVNLLRANLVGAIMPEGALHPGGRDSDVSKYLTMDCR